VRNTINIIVVSKLVSNKKLPKKILITNPIDITTEFIIFKFLNTKL